MSGGSGVSGGSGGTPGSSGSSGTSGQVDAEPRKVELSAAGTPVPERWKSLVAAVWTGQLFSFLFSMAANYALIWYLTETTGSATILALSTIMHFIPMALLGPFAGTIVDRYNRRSIMIVTDICVAAVTILMAFLIILGFTSVPLVLFILLLRSTGTAFHMPAMLAAMPLLVPDRHLVRIASLDQGIMGASNIAGPALGIVLYTALGLQLALFGGALGALIAAAILLSVRIPEVHLDKGERTGVFHELADGFRAVRNCRGMTPLFVVIMFGCMAFMPIASLFPLMTFNHFGGDGYAASLVEAVFGIGFLLGSVVLGVWGGGRRLVLVVVISTIGQALAFGGCGLLSPDAFTLFVVLSGLGGIADAFFSGPLNALIQRRIAPEKLGRVMALLSSVMSFSAPVGLAIAGPIAERIGVAAWFVISGICLFAAGVAAFLTPSIRSLDDTPTLAAEPQQG